VLHLEIEDKKKISSNDYADLLFEINAREEYAELEDQTINIINEKFGVIYFPVSQIRQTVMRASDYSVIPKLYGLVETLHLEEMGVRRVQNTQFLGLRGQGVLIGFVDTGIDYNNPLFKNADNTTRILSIWDQTIDNPEASEEIFSYGREFLAEEINLALQNENPLSVVPTTDENGHGTTLAGLAGGSIDEENDFIGVVSLSEFVVVKLKPAKQNLRDYFGVADDAICYQENDILAGIAYLTQFARKLDRPIAICIGLGSNQGSHDGRGTLSDTLAVESNRVGTAVVIAAGNEGNRGHHYYGEIDKSIGFDVVELRIGEKENNFSMDLWGNLPGTYSIDILSPSGEYISRIPARLGESREINFIFEATTIYISYLIVESQTGDQLILFRFRNPAPGIWRFNVYGGEITSGFHIWLPMQGFITDNTVFVRPNPDTTITEPGNAALALTVTAYDHVGQNIYRNASRGYSRTGIVKPELTAPGVDVFSPTTENTYTEKSGTSIAAALTTGVAAMLLEWGIIRGNDRTMDTIAIEKYLIRGVKRNPNLSYPNREWGYGVIDIYRTFENLRGETI
jgi:subtilisin family serine protease